MTTADHATTANEPNLVVLDVGHGNASIIQENGVFVVIDTGVRNQLAEYLFEQGIYTIDLVVLSHSDFDHIGGLQGILTAGIIVNEVKLNSDADKDTEAWRDLIKVLDDLHYSDTSPLKWSVGIAHGRLDIPGFKNTSLEVVAPTRTLVALGVGAKDFLGRAITNNSISSVIRISYEKVPIALLTGDMDEVSLDEIAKRKIDISAKYLVFPHHGGLPGGADPATFAAKLMHAVQPISVIFSLGRDKHSNPNQQIIQTVINTNKSVYVKCTQLSKHCAETIPSAVRTYDTPIFAAGLLGKKCCAGSIDISLEHPEIGDYTLTAHYQFVTTQIPKALCKPHMLADKY